MSTSRNAVPGRFRVEQDACTSCGACGALAPAHFEPAEGGWGYVTYRQPQSAVELARCSDALACCPVDAIRDQGSPDGGTTTVQATPGTSSGLV